MLIGGYAMTLNSGRGQAIWEALGLSREQALGCGRNSPKCAALYLPMFAEHLGVSIPLLGLIAYTGLALFAWQAFLARHRVLSPDAPVAAATSATAEVLERRRRLAIVRLRLWVVLALGSTSYFVAFQALFTPGFCPVCMTSAACVVLVTLVVLGPRESTYGLAPADIPGRFTIRRCGLLAAVALLLGAGAAFGLRQVWHPLEAAEQRKTEFLQTIPRRSTGPLRPEAGEPPRLVLAVQEGCVFCTVLISELADDERARRLLVRYTFEWTDPAVDPTFEKLAHLQATPTFVVLLPDGSWNKLEGYHRPEVVRAFLKHPFAARFARETPPR